MTQTITRHFVTIDGRWGPRQVHYRRAGTGPAVLLLHQSPQSSREMTALMGRWAQHFTLIAPDTPGYGQSDPLGPPVASIAEFAQALAEFVDAIGLRRFGVYGYHTGASVGLWLAAAHPERVAGMAANGLCQLTDAERANILASYLPPITPTWDGGHLAWLWGRVREQAIFFPWHERSAAARMPFDVPAPAVIQAALVEMLNAGDNYPVAYRAAFESRPETVLPGLRVPLLVTAGGADPLKAHLERLRDLPPCVEREAVATGPAAVERCLPHLLAHRGDPAPAAPATRPIAGRLWSRYLATPDGQLRVRLRVDGGGEPVVIVHGAGGSSDTVLRFAAGAGTNRPVAVPDLPGHGESDPLARTTGPGVADGAAAVLATLHGLGLSRAALVGQGAGACVALEAARRGGLREPRLGLLDVPALTEAQRAAWREHGLPQLAPEWYGGHLLLAWHLLRDGRLFFPWFDRTAAGAVPVEPDLDPRQLLLELRELLKSSGSARNLMRDVLDYPLASALADAGAHVALGAGPASAWQGATRAAAALAPGLRCLALPADAAGWVATLLEAVR
jgi:pimeloyl-ACP methyl ester carboxylesterase